jgi:hypothetical protein
MASYNNDYNRAIARRQKGLDVANLQNDYQQSLMNPLHGGGMSGGDFWSDFADGFMSVWNPIIDTAGKVAPFLPLIGLGEGEEDDYYGGDMSVNAPYEGYVYGSGYSGGAIANDGEPPFNMPTNAGMSGGRARDRPKWIVKQNDYCCIKDMKKPMACNGDPLPKAFMNDYRKKSNDFEKYREGKLPGYKGNGMSGGDEIADTDHPLLRNPELQATMFLGGRKPSSVSKKEKIGMVQQVIADMLARKRGRGMSGGDFWSDLGDTFSKVAPFLPLLGLGYSGGAGESGGQARQLQKQLANKLLKAQLKNLHGRGLSGGDFDWSSLLSFAPLLLGLGMSGGEVDYSELQDMQPFITGLGMSGGDFWDDLSKGFSDAWSWVTDTAIPAITPVIDTAGKIADVAGKFSGSKEGKKEGKGYSGGMYDKAKYGMGYSGGAMTYEQNMNMADAMGDIFSGMGASGGARASDTRMKSGAVQLYKGGSSAALEALQERSNVNQPYLTGHSGGAGASGGAVVGGKRQTKQSKMNERLAMKIAHLKGRGMEPTADMEASEKLVDALARNTPQVNAGAGVSGGKKTSKWIEHVKAYAKKHGIKYGDALKQAKATYRG